MEQRWKNWNEGKSQYWENILKTQARSKKQLILKDFPKVFGQWCNIFKAWGQWYFCLIDTSCDCQDLNVIDEDSDGYWLNVIDLDIEWHSLWQTHLNFAGTPYSDLFNLYKQLFYNIGGLLYGATILWFVQEAIAWDRWRWTRGPRQPAVTITRRAAWSLCVRCTIVHCTPMWNSCTQLGLCVYIYFFSFRSIFQR